MAGVAERAAERLAGVPSYRRGLPGPGPAAGKLSSNESPLGPSPAVRAAITAAASSVNRYPEPESTAEILAARAGVARSQIVLTNGSDELCYLVASLLLGRGRVAVVGDPCYQIDATATLLAGATVRRVPLDSGGHDLEAMAKASVGASVVWIPSPHNPTGVASDPDDLARFMSAVPEDCLVVLDEAYRAFSDRDRRPDVTRLLGAHPNLLVQRTLSKDFALAGLRVGYALTSATLARSLETARAPFSVNSIALSAVSAALASDSWRTMAIARVREERSRLEAALRRLHIEHYPSQANFVTARVDLSLLAGRLGEAGLALRSGSDLGLPGWTRISIGWAPQMAVLRSILFASLDGASHPSDMMET